MISFTVKGDWNRTTKFFTAAKEKSLLKNLDSYGKEGVKALKEATPRDTGKTADSWDYRIEKKNGVISIIWTNTNVNNGVNIAIILQYGHGTRNGGYVKGRDYINPAMQPVFDKLAEDAWREVKNL